MVTHCKCHMYCEAKKVVRLVKGGVEQVVLISYLVVKNTVTLSLLGIYYGLANAW